MQGKKKKNYLFLFIIILRTIDIILVTHDIIYIYGKQLRMSIIFHFTYVPTLLFFVIVYFINILRGDSIIIEIITNEKKIFCLFLDEIRKIMSQICQSITFYSLRFFYFLCHFIIRVSRLFSSRMFCEKIDFAWTFFSFLGADWF